MGGRVADYQARVVLGGEAVCMTNVAGSTDTPFWGTAFSFSELPTTGAKSVTVQVGRPIVGLLQLRASVNIISIPALGQLEDPHIGC